MTFRSEQTVDRRTLAVGVLSVTAVILLVGIVIVQMFPATVRADGMSISGGDYIMTVGALVDTDEEYIYVIDVPSSKLAVYRFDVTRHRIQIIQGIELSRLRTPTGDAIPIADEDEDDAQESDGDPTP